VSEQNEVTTASPLDGQNAGLDGLAAGEAALPRRGRNARPGHRRRWPAVTAVVVVLAGGGAAIGYYKPFSSPPAPSSPSAASAAPTGLASVKQTSLSETAQASGTLGYASSYNVVVPTAGSSPGNSSSGNSSSGNPQPSATPSPSGSDETSGTFTALPAVGQVVTQGQSLYSVSGSPAVLLYGSVPAYRSLSQGMSGTDVQQLNADLVALGYATRSELDPSSDEFSSATATALEKLQDHLGLAQTGTLPLGQAVFEPTALIVTTVSANLGASVQAGAPVLQATSTTRQVVAQVDANELSDVAAGAQVSIVLPDTRTTPGVVTGITSQASAPSSGSASSTPAPSSSSAPDTVNVDIKMTDPSAAGAVTQAPVEVNITTQTVSNVLAVPIEALVTEPGGYDVEVAGAGGRRRLVPVQLGLFDDNADLVQVSGSGLTAGEQVVVPQL
jgi:Putative peptidoglycan binding domain